MREKMKKKILSVLLCLVLLAGLIPTVTFAAELQETQEDWYPFVAGILRGRNQGTKNILSGTSRDSVSYSARKRAGMLDSKGNIITYA